tara:strand:- start:37253 stop:46921 length:9669 start_codon:yes stop_codon:yes gene_type:complete
MAKKRQQNKSKTPSTSSVNTSTPIKGMIKDVDSAYFSKENWWHARNLANNSIDGDTGVVGNEPANLACGEVPYTIIGTIHLYGDKWVLYSTDDTTSEIGLFDDSKCEYTTLVNAPCLNFNRRNLIIGAAKENFDCTWQVYWDDNLNPSRTLNIDNVPYIQQIVSGPGDPCIIYEDTDQLDCEKLRLHPLMDMACLRLEKADEGGALNNGSYQAFIAYCEDAQQIGDYFINSNITSVWSHENTNSSIVLHLDNLDTDFEFFKLVIRTRIANAFVNYEFGVYSTETKRIPIDFIDPELPTVTPTKLLLDNPVFEKSAGMFVVNDYLIRSQPTEYFDFNYQPLANQIKTFWVTTEYPEDYYKNGGNNPTFLRDEQYAFFIRFIYNTGEFSKSYHIPGRAPRSFLGGNETSIMNGANLVDPGTDRVYNVYNTATTLTNVDPFIISLQGTETEDGGIITGGGEMGYWQSTEVYPQTQPERYNATAHPWSNPGTTEFDLCGLPIRHHKFPDESLVADGITGNSLTSLYNTATQTINVLGVAFDNIAPPVDNDGNLIENIVGYQIMVGSRDGKKSIIAKGIIKNMIRFRKDRNDDTFSGLMPNYPFNDLRIDPYLLARDKGNRNEEPWFANILGWDGGVEDNWLGGNVDMSDTYASKSINGIEQANSAFNTANNGTLLHNFYGFNKAGTFDASTYTFHSPDLNFSKTYLNPTELKIYKTIHGPVAGRFKTVEGHTQHKLLKNKVVTLAAIYGTGYAIMKMRGERNYGYKSTRSYSTGEIGTYPGVNAAPAPGLGVPGAAATTGVTGGAMLGQIPGEYALAGVVDSTSITGLASETSKLHILGQYEISTGAAALAAGHVGPEFTMNMRDSEFNSVPGVVTVISGILQFLNFLAIGGDKLVQLILDLVSFQDYAMKYISHGFYKNERPIDLNSNFRVGIDRARYIKQAIQSFDGDTIVNNVLRPSTVVLRHRTSDEENPGVITLQPPAIMDNTKFTIGMGPCAGDGVSQSNWWMVGEEVASTCSAHYISIKNQIDNQYGQLDSIIQLPIFGCTTSYAQLQEKDGSGNLIPVKASDRFNTGVLFGGDTYIARYTEKTNMPFFYQFLRDDESKGYQFNYSRYANVPFPRYWMNTEKYRMGEFVRPITTLEFNWSGAFPDSMYNLDTPDNGGYCAPSIIGGGTIDPPPLGEGNLGGDLLGAPANSYSAIFTPSIPPTTGPPPGVQYVGDAESQRYIVYNIAGTNNIDYAYASGANTFSFNKQNHTVTFTYPNSTAVDQAVTDQLNTAGLSGGSVDINITFNFTAPIPYDMPLGSGSGNCDIDTHVDCSPLCTGTWSDFSFDSGGGVLGVGDLSNFRVIFDWATLTVVGITANAVGTKYAAQQFSSASSTTHPVTGLPYTGTPVPTVDDFTSIDFGSDAMTQSNTSNSNTYELKTNAFQVVDGKSRCRNGSATSLDITGSVQGTPPPTNTPTAGIENYENSAYNPNNNTNQNPPSGGLFVWKFAYMYTHNSGINDFWVESDFNLAYRDYEDEKRKRHYDDEEYTDLVELFHSKIIDFDNYYNYDKSVGVRRYWSVSFSKIQERWYDATTAEQCFTQYPKRLIYSVPATGFMDKKLFQNKNDKAIDFWRVFLAENYRDFKAPINAIVPYNQTGALMLFPTLSPRVFQGVDKLQLTKKKVLIGDGGLFSQVLQNAANSNVSHEYGSCESYRSVLNTPQGVYFASQAQGKIFLYQAGKGLQAISDIGMKWWFNKFLPSRLLADFPEVEDCPEFIDNPVIAAGINTVYDPNDDIVYFCKRDYKVHDDVKKCIDFIPCEGFVYNATTCDGVAQTQDCPEGYEFIPGSVTCPPGAQLVYQDPNTPICIIPGQGGTPIPATVTEDQCCLTTTEPALFTQGVGQLDVVIVVDSSNSVNQNGNVAPMINFVNTIITELDNVQSTNGDVRIGLVHFGAGRGQIAGNLHNMQATPYTTGDTMFDIGDQLALTDDFSSSGAIYSWMNNVYTPAVQQTDVPNGTEMLGGIWAGMNLLYGTNGRPSAAKRLITITDGPQFSNTEGTYFFSYDPLATPPERDTHVNAGTVNPLTPDINFGPMNEDVFQPGVGPVYHTAPSPAGAWFQTNIVNNTNYPNQKSFLIGLDTRQGDPSFVGFPNANQQQYFDQFADPTDPTDGIDYSYYGSFQDPASISTIVDAIMSAVVPPPDYYCPDSNCDLIMASVPVCRCTVCEDPTFNDVTYPVELQDEQYFKDVSWTVSYDPKSKAWISFHDWHPELTMNSINHFLTTKSQEGTVPICPPGFTWNGVECCTTGFQQAPAVPIVNEILADVNTVPTGELTNVTGNIDICFSIDYSGSTSNPASNQPNSQSIWELQKQFVINTIQNLDFSDGNVRVGFSLWHGSTLGLGAALTTNAASVISTLQAIPNPNPINSTNYGEAIRSANFVVNSVDPDTLADEVVAIVITDSAADVSYTLNIGNDGAGGPNPLYIYSDLFTNVKVVKVHQGNGTGAFGDGCDDLGWQMQIQALIDRFYTQWWIPIFTEPPATTVCVDEGCENLNGFYGGFSPEFTGQSYVVCNAPAQGANLYEVTSCTNCNVCNTCYQNVALEILQQESVLTCNCPPDTIPDQNPANPPCENIDNPPLCVVDCTCPPGYVLIGECNNSANPPICRSVDCACPPSEDLGLPAGVIPTSEGSCDEELIETVNTTTIESTEADGENVGQQLFLTNPGFNGPTGLEQTPDPWMRGYQCKNSPTICFDGLTDPNQSGTQTMTADTLPFNDPFFGSQGQNLAPYEGSSYVGLVSSKVVLCQPTDLCCATVGGGILDNNIDITYYQEGVWQRLLDANGTPTEMEMNIEYTGAVQLSQIRDHIVKSYGFGPGGCQETGSSPSCEQNLDYAPSIEIWGGTHSPLSQGDNYKGNQFGYPLGTDIVGYSKMLWRSAPVTSVDQWVEYQYSLNVNDSDGSIEAEYGKFKYIFIKIQIVTVADGQPAMLPATAQFASKYVVMDGFTNPRIPTVTETVTTTTTETVLTNTQICTYETQICTPPNYITGGIWRHNVRTDLFANFYNVQYPWEVDILETTGQTVNTLRSVEYHLESYFYSEDQLNRFHDLDYNFDEAVIYNSEQISGLLNLVLTPKNNTPLAMSYPIFNADSIDILFSKEEQKYRFNQFFDVTNDRGEFSGAITQMFETEQNGYIINLNQANLNYNKPQHERKKFRHYFNHLILRKSADAAMTRKMLLRLENFKLNVSFR